MVFREEVRSQAKQLTKRHTSVKVPRQWYFQGLFVIKRSASRIQSVLCSDWKSQSWFSKWQIRVRKSPLRNPPPPFDGVAKQNCSSTWRHRSPVAMPMLPYKRGEGGGGLCLAWRTGLPAAIGKIEGNQRKPIAIWRKFVIRIPVLSLAVRIVSLAGRDFPPAAQLPATIKAGGWIGEVGVHTAVAAAVMKRQPRFWTRFSIRHRGMSTKMSCADL